MIDLETGGLTVEPIISYPREAESGKSYLLSIDLRPFMTPEDKWPLANEECTIYCLLNTAPLFSNRALGEPAVVIHRFGGSYGPARFLLTAADEEMVGMIRVTLVNGWGVPLGELTRDIHITKRGVAALPSFILTNRTEAAHSTMPGSPMQSLEWDNRLQTEQDASFPVGGPSSVASSDYRGVVGLPPMSDPKIIQQREAVVKEVYTTMIQPDITAIVLTGIGGVGKSTLAALVYNYAEEQRLAGNGPFTAGALWLSVDSDVTMVDLAGTLFEALGKPILDFSTLPPWNQAVVLFNALNEVEKPRLLVLDHFDNLLDQQTGHALSDRAGIDEWIDTINNQKCTCRILLTSRLSPRGTREYPQVYMQEYPVRGMRVAEGIELLRKQGIRGTEAELRTAVERCDGHALALMLLASLLRRNSSLNLIDLLENPTYAQFWIGDVARSFLDYIYTRQLDKVQRKLLLAFSVYREVVPLEAVQAVLDFSDEVSNTQIVSALDVLLAQHLLQTTEQGNYQLHGIVASYAQSHFDESDERANEQALQTAHAKAAEYYLQRSAIDTPPHEKRRSIKDVQLLIEAVWQLCQAGQWQEAYNLMEQEEISENLLRWGGNTILLELYQLLLPQNKWQPGQPQLARIYSNLGRIHYSLEQLEHALQYYEQALSIYKEVQDYYGEGSTLNNLGRVYYDLGQLEHAREYYERALMIRREIGDRGGEGVTLNNLGEIYSQMGHLERALEYYQHALSIVSEVGDRRGEGVTLNNLGQVYNALGRKQDALRYYEQALSFVRVVGDHRGEGVTLNNLGEIYSQLGQFEQALEYYQQALSIVSEVGDRRGEGLTLNNLGQVYNALGWKQDALRYYEQALGILRRVGNRRGEGVTLWNVGSLYFEQSRYEVALACFLVAKRIFEDLQSPGQVEVQKWIDNLSRQVGEQRFDALLKEVESRALQILEQALSGLRPTFTTVESRGDKYDDALPIRTGTIILFILGRPGSGKSTAARYIGMLARDRGQSAFLFDDYHILYEMFQADVEHRGFRPIKYGGFDVIDLSVFDVALRQLEKSAQAAIENEDRNKIVIIQFARGDYSQALRQFRGDLLQHAYFLFIDADLDTCIQRIHRRVVHPTTLDDYFVSEELLRTYYSKDNKPYIFSGLKADHDIDDQKVMIIENIDSIEAFLRGVEPFVEFVFTRSLWRQGHV